MDNKNISGERIRQARLKQGMEQVEISAALEARFGLPLTQSDISEIERGARGVKDYELDALAKVLDVSPLWLLQGEDQDDEQQ